MSRALVRRLGLPAVILLLGLSVVGAGVLGAHPSSDAEWGERQQVAVVTARSTRRPMVLAGAGTLRALPGAVSTVVAPTAGRVTVLAAVRGQWAAAS